MSIQGTVTKHWIGLSYTCSEDCNLNHNFDDTELKASKPHIQQ